MTVSSSRTSPGSLLRSFAPFDRLQPEQAAAIEPLLEARRFALGQTLLRPDVNKNA